MAQTSTAPAATAFVSTTVATRVVWTLQILIALFFAVASALPKLLALSSAVSSFDTIGAGSWFMYLTGALELSGAVALVLRPLAGSAALALIGLLVGAFITQMVAFHGDNAAFPVILMVPLAVIAWSRRRQTATLVSGLLRLNR
ncbi:DoxX family protein [Streptacidiphilus sp. PAMC 29251]